MKKENILVTLLAIYAILLTLCVAIYALMEISGIDKGSASNLMVWSATIFATIALLYTFNEWKNQRKLEEISTIAQALYKDLSKAENEYQNIASYIDTINMELMELNQDRAKELLISFNERIANSYKNIYKIKSYSTNTKHIEKLELYLKETSEIHNYLHKIAYNHDYYIQDISSIQDYYRTYDSMRESIFQISIFDF
jgi:hypothetical protein